MKITVDTNVLVRAAVQDDESQSSLAATVLKQAELIAISLPVLCEFVWVLKRGYKKPVADIASAIHQLMNTVNVVMNEPAVEAGLQVLNAGGDFADGVIAYEGEFLGADRLVSFDKKAVSVLQSLGRKAELPGLLQISFPDGPAS